MEPIMIVPTFAKASTILATVVGVMALVYQPPRDANDLPNRIPEAAPYVTAEAQAFPPPFEEHWVGQNSPGQCQTCHKRIFDEWNGSMMANAWRDPLWRSAFLLSARETSSNGECDTPQPPDGTPKAAHNPFAIEGLCASSFDIGGSSHTVSRPGSLLDGFCSRCHMPSNYVDNVPLSGVTTDPRTGAERAVVDPRFNPTSDAGTGLAFATLDAQYRNTDSGKAGVFCAICHTFVETRDTPFHNFARSKDRYAPAIGAEARSESVPAGRQDTLLVPDGMKRNLGYSIGAGSFRLSPHAIGFPERFGPLAANGPPSGADDYLSSTFGRSTPHERMDAAKHKGYRQVMFTRAEMCAACHDVTNSLPIRNAAGKWVGGFPIERTYTEWANSRYADRPGNANFDPRFKRDCQTCHMQQDYGQPGTAQTLYKDGQPLPPLVDRVATDGGPHPFFTHHFVGGNAYVTNMIGRSLDGSGGVAEYPELSTFSFSSADKNSPYANAYWMYPERRGSSSQQARLAWDRLRHVVSLDVAGPPAASSGTAVPITITVANTGSGHDFPTGFPEGRTAWVAVRAFDLDTGNELPIRDSFWKRTSLGVGRLTTAEMPDPNFEERCHWSIPAGSADPYAVQFKAVASLGDGCPTLDLVYAAPLNLVTSPEGLPVDGKGRLIDASNPEALVQFRDANGDGDFFDDSFLRDTRLKPMPLPGATRKLDRYSVVIPPGVRGPVAVTAAVYYQSAEAMVARKFLGNLADTNTNGLLEPCALGGLCDGRHPQSEPAAVEGAPPVPMAVRNLVITINGAQPVPRPLDIAVYPPSGAGHVYQDIVVKAFFPAPVRSINPAMFTLKDSRGAVVPASVGQIGDGTWALFPSQVFLERGGVYTARLAAGICDVVDRCTTRDLTWSFTVAEEEGKGEGDTSVPMGFTVTGQRH
jgi:hypothetical protein